MHFYRLLSWAMLFALATPVFAQDTLEDDLKAIDDLPEDDLSADQAPDVTQDLPPDATSQNSSLPNSSPLSQSLDELPVEQGNFIKSNNDGLEQLASEPESTPPVVDAPSSVASEPSPLDALTGIDADGLGKVKGVEFKQLKDRVRLYVRSDRPLDWSRELRSEKRQIVIELRNMNIANSIVNRALDTGEFDGPVAFVKAYDAKLGNIPTVKVLFQLRNFVDPTILRSGNDLYVDFPILSENTLFTEKNDNVVLPEMFLSGNQAMEYKGARINLNIKEAPLADVIGLISKISGQNFVIAPGINLNVTLNVRNTPWDQILAIVLLNNKLGYQKSDGIFRIATLSDLKNEIADAVASEEKKLDLLPIQTRLFAVSYAQASTIASNIKDFLSKRGKTAIDTRTNSMTISDTAEVLEKVDRYIKAVDKQTPQVQIEARIVEASKEFTKALNVRWNMGLLRLGRVPSATGNIGTGSLTEATPSRFSPSIPFSSAGGGKGGGAGINIGELGSLGSIDLLIGASERNDEVKQIASPKVTVLNNVQATIKQGFTRTIQGQASANGTVTNSTQSISTDLSVKPQVTNDGNIMLQVTLSRSTPTGVAGSAQAGDSKDRSVTTEMIVGSGKTAVIGGLYTAETIEGNSSVPGLAKIPIIGSLFKTESGFQKNFGELLMFISPKILNADKAFLVNTMDVEPLSSSGPSNNKTM